MPVAKSVPAITIHQPWATLLARGLKVHETRSWYPPAWLVGKRLAIHAGAHYTMAHEVSDALSDILDREHLNSMPMALGAVVGTARLVAVHRTDDRLSLVSADDDAAGDWSPGRYAWEMEDSVEFAEPIPCRGAQKVWTWAPGEGTCLVCGAADGKCPGGVVWADGSRRLCAESECRRLALAGGVTDDRC
jgi:activating signal cointegrator 1